MYYTGSQINDSWAELPSFLGFEDKFTVHDKEPEGLPEPWGLNIALTPDLIRSPSISVEGTNADLTFALCCLRDEIQNVVFMSHLTPSVALEALEILREAYPGRRQLFNKHLIYAWCHTDESWANHGYQLLEIYAQDHSFLSASTHVKQIICQLKAMGAGAFSIILEAVLLTLGSKAAAELQLICVGDSFSNGSAPVA